MGRSLSAGRKTTHVVSSQVQEVSCRDDTYHYDKGKKEKEDIDHGLTYGGGSGVAERFLLLSRLLLMTLWPLERARGGFPSGQPHEDH
jgi:hypothetical protein